MSDEAKRRGRPPKAAGEKKNVNFTFRARADLRDKLSASAEANSRSISEEIERRLEESYTQQDRFIEILGGYKNIRLIMAITSSWKMIEELSGKSWTESFEVFDAMRAATDNAFVISKSFIDVNAKQPANTLLDMDSINELTRFEDIKNFAEAAAVYGSSMANGREPSKKLVEMVRETASRFRGLVDPGTHASDA